VAHEEALMKKVNPLVFAIALMISVCGCAKKTEPVPIPPAQIKGPLHIALTPSEDMTKEDIVYLKNTFEEQFGEAGYDPVSVSKTRRNAENELDIQVDQYDRSRNSNAGCVLVSGICTSICWCMAPCLLFPNYVEDQFEFVINVTAYRKGRVLFADRIAEEGHSSANVVKSGTTQFKRELKELVINNSVAKIMGKMNQ
jgi:hypothetical protein